MNVSRDLTVNGATSITGAINFGSTSNGARAILFTGAVTLNNGAVWTEPASGNGANNTYNFANNFTNNATTFTAAGTGTHTFSGTGRTNSGTTTTSIPSVAITGTRTNSGTLTVATAITGNGTLTNGATGVLNYGGSGAIAPTLNASAAGNTVNYNRSGTQTVKATTYSNLSLSGANAKTIATNTSVLANMDISGTAVANIGTNLTISVNSLSFAGVGQLSGTWGSPSSSAVHQDNTHFSATNGRLNVATSTAVLLTPTFTFGTAPTPTYLGGNFTTSATTDSNGALTYSRVSGPCALVSGGTFSSSGAGVCLVQANTEATATYAAGSAQQSISIAQASQTITFNALANKTTLDPDFNVSATATSGLAVSFSAAGTCTIAGTLVHITGVGNCTITAAQAGNANYLAATSVDQAFTISSVSALDLYAVTGSTTLPGSATPVTVWGYNYTGSPATQPGGPVIVVNQGETVTIILHNNLGVGENTALLFQGQNLIPDTSGAGAGGTKTYTFVASQPGTFLYEAGLILGKQHQVAMGLYGALIVRPTSFAAVPGQAYAGTTTAFTNEQVLVLSELDTALNANPLTFDMRKYSPKYYLINGKAYPNTADLSVVAGDTVLLRYVNAGLQAHAMSTLGVSQTIIGHDGNPIKDHVVVAETIAPGQTLDTLVSIPSAAVQDSQYPLYDASLFLRNNKGTASTSGLGGMLTTLKVGTGAPPPPSNDTTGPVASALALSPNPTNGSVDVSISANISDVSTGNSTIDQAEFSIDSGSPIAMTGTFDSPSVAVSGTIPAATLAGLSSGNHTISVRGHDALGNWGVFASIVLSVDKEGPATTGLTLSPNLSDGTVDIVLAATGNDTTTGNSNVVAAEYWIDSGSPVVMIAGGSDAPIRSLTATIPAGLSSGTYVVSVRSQDAFGNWGAPATISLTVDSAKPTANVISASPNPNNGTAPFNSSVLAVRVTANFSDISKGNSNIVAAEGFLDVAGPTGTGFVFIANDGIFNSPMENGYADIPLPVIATLSTGSHPICIHAKDAAGNWGDINCSYNLVIDSQPPTISSATLTPATIAFGAASVTLNVTANDGTGTGVSGGQYWIDGSATPPANPTAFVSTPVSINTSTLAAGTHTVYVQMKDGAANWSTVSSLTLYVVQAVNDARTITANNNTTQTSDANATAGLLTNDQPVGVAGRTVGIASAPGRTSGNGTGTITVTCPSGLGIAAPPAISGNTVCTNGTYRVTLNGNGSSNNQRTASKRGTYQFTYTLTLNGVTSTATVTITVN
jgi:FtsP/CotA-like multicopper oxidase with cupredoxin domain